MTRSGENEKNDKFKLYNKEATKKDEIKSDEKRKMKSAKKKISKKER